MEELHELVVPSPKSNRYCTECPRLQLAPPVENVSDTLHLPDEEPLGVLGLLTVCSQVILTDLLEDHELTTEWSLEQRA